MNKKEIYFAGGCFWGVEAFLKNIRGVIETEVGYANGTTKNPTYKEVCTQNTGYAETVRIFYNPKVLTIQKLVEFFFEAIDPTSLNKQGNDIGTQYRSGVYFCDINDEKLILDKIEVLQNSYAKKILVEVKPLKNFYPAESYHQDYLDKNKNGYCHISRDILEYAKIANSKSSERFLKLDKAILRKKLSPLQYAVTQENATEPAFQNEYNNEFKAGIYVDITTGEPLFLSTNKFNSGCGWPSFSKPISKNLILEKENTSHFMIRTEVRSVLGDAHLGHVFNDGPPEKGELRYCINSAALRFIPKDKMIEEGYEDFLLLLK